MSPFSLFLPVTYSSMVIYMEIHMYLFYSILLLNGASHVSQLVKNPLANEGERDMGSIRGLG